MTASYSVRIRRSAEKEIRRLPQPARRRIIAAIGGLAADPRPAGCVKLTGRSAWRVRIGPYRIVYTVDDAVLVIEVVKVGHRQDVYR